MKEVFKLVKLGAPCHSQPAVCTLASVPEVMLFSLLGMTFPSGPACKLLSIIQAQLKCLLFCDIFFGATLEEVTLSSVLLPILLMRVKVNEGEQALSSMEHAWRRHRAGTEQAQSTGMEQA